MIHFDSQITMKLYSIHLYAYTGAYELLKAAKEHETEFHDNPNYITVFAYVMHK